MVDLCKNKRLNALCLLKLCQDRKITVQKLIAQLINWYYIYDRIPPDSEIYPQDPIPGTPTLIPQFPFIYSPISRDCSWHQFICRARI